MIIDGKIKLKNGTQIERFTSKGLKFTDGSELEADVVVLATGCAFPFPSYHTPADSAMVVSGIPVARSASSWVPRRARRSRPSGGSTPRASSAPCGARSGCPTSGT